MIHEPIVVVECDCCAAGCEITLSEGVVVEEAIVEDGWIISNGKHYCSLACAEEDE